MTANQPVSRDDHLRVAAARVDAAEAERKKADPMADDYKYASEIVREQNSNTIYHLDEHIRALKERRSLLDDAIANAEATRDQVAKAHASIPQRPARF